MNMNTPDTIEVTPLDMDKVSEMLTTAVGEPAEMSGRWAIIGREDGAWGLVYDECVLVFPNKGIDAVPIDIWKKQEGVIYMIPAWKGHLTREDVREMTLPPTTLRDFMGSRYNYNGRIQSNTAGVCQWMQESN